LIDFVFYPHNTKLVSKVAIPNRCNKIQNQTSSSQTGIIENCHDHDVVPENQKYCPVVDKWWVCKTNMIASHDGSDSASMAQDDLMVMV